MVFPLKQSIHRTDKTSYPIFPQRELRDALLLHLAGQVREPLIQPGKRKWLY